MNDYILYGSPEAEVCILRLTGAHEKEKIEYEIDEIRRLAHDTNLCVACIPVHDWEKDLTPWGTQEPFFDDKETGAKDTLIRITDEIIGDISSHRQSGAPRYYLAGYSLAGLFALWASYQTDIFDGIAAVSPSVWYPGWMEYIEKKECRSHNIYLSIGSKEHKTRNQMMAHVRSNITKMHESFLENDYNSFLEINEGNHFKEPHIRMAKGIRWLMENAK